MSGDVQPRKRKDKKRKKDDLGVHEPRGTSAALGEGDVFMHSHHDHGTGGHWCAKVIFFSLLAILVALIGLIILENRGLSELEANAVQSQYSGVLEGWLEDAPEDDHHDAHTLELNHHDDENDADDHGEEIEHSEELEDDHDEENDDDEGHDEDDGDEGHDDDDEGHDEDDDDEETEDDGEDTQEEDGSQEQNIEANEEDEDLPYRKHYHANEAETDDDDDDDDDEQENDDDDEYNEEENEDLSNEDDDDNNEEENEQLNNEDDEDNDNDDDDDNDNDDEETKNQSLENDEDDDDGDNDVDENVRDNGAGSEENNNEDEEKHEEEEEDTSLEVENIEQEASEEEPISTELPALPEPDDEEDDNKVQLSAEDVDPEAADDDVNEPDDDFLEADDDEPPIERITAPAGKPFTEVEEETSSEKPADTLAEEEEYEKQQEELRREEAQASHMWLKLTVGGALLVATHAIVRRATASGDAPQTAERVSREETLAIDRRMTLIPEETGPVPIKKVTQESSRPVIQDMPKHIPSITKSAPTFEESEEEVEEEEEEQDEPIVSKVAHIEQEVRKEVYSDEEEEADDEEIEEVEKEVEKKVAQAQAAKQPSPEPDEDVPDDVEIIEDEQIEEEAEEEDEDEEEISDVDDEELLTRLEAKYGRLPEPDKPQRRKDGGNSIEDEWPGEPSEAYWRQQLDQAEQEFNQGAWPAAAERAGAKALQSSARARWLVAKSLDALAEKKRDNTILGRAITAYLELLKMNERLSDKKLLEVSERTINRIQFRGTYLNAEPVYRLLIRRFPDNPDHRTNLTVLFLMANRADLAEDVLKETLKRWPDDRLAMAQYGFILKTHHNRLEEALHYLQKALEGDTGPATEPRFYYHLGDTLLLLGRFDEAHEVHKRGAVKGHFLSASQRSLYNVPRLKGRPWWNIEDTPYVELARALEKSWQAILREGQAAKALYEQEKEGLKERGEWSQLDLFVRGREIPGRCTRAPVTCSIVKSEVAAAGCRRGQIKFSLMEAGTHVRPHVGPTNCRLRMHLGLSNTKDTFIRVDQETRQWKAGKVFVFDDSFEHEVWHNGTGPRLVLIVDVWHPELTPAERRQLPAI